MSRIIYDIDPAGDVLCTYTDNDNDQKESLRIVSLSDAPNLIVRGHFNYTEEIGRFRGTTCDDDDNDHDNGPLQSNWIQICRRHEPTRAAN